MKKITILFVLVLTILSCNPTEDIVPPILELQQIELGTIEGIVLLSNEYGVHPFGLEETIKVYLLDENLEVIEELTKSVDDRNFKFENLYYKKYYIYAESPNYDSCHKIELDVNQENLYTYQEVDILSKNFTAQLNSVTIDSLVGDRMYHSFDIDKISYKSLGVRFYLSDDPTVTNQNYKETVMNLAAWASPETSGQYNLFLRITPELYEGDSIYVSVYLVNLDAEECIGDNGLIYHYPYDEDYITVGFSK
ncbi:MAG: hypothetical protein P1U56_18355 [Saprospiraceae bacterium]|nr:hypothetical protein [Saprospiraceae bacterium]